MRLPAEHVSQRDSEIYRAKMQGMSFRQIADLMKISPSTAHDGYKRYLRKVAKMYSEIAPDAVYMHLEQLDSLMLSLMPMTRPHKITTPDGEEIDVPPNTDATKTVLQILRDKAKILSYENNSVTVNMGGSMAVPALTTSGSEKEEHTPEVFAKELFTEMTKAGVLAGPAADALKKIILNSNDDDIIDAEIIEEIVLEQESPEEQTNIPPPWIEEEDEEYIPGSWVPSNTESGDDYKER